MTSSKNDTDQPARTLQVNYRWRKNVILVSEGPDTPPLYLVKYNRWNMKTVFKSGPSVAKLTPDDASETFNDDAASDDIVGESRVRVFMIDCDVRIRDRNVKLSPVSRLFTKYNYPSLAYSADGVKPALMTWEGKSFIKCFDHELRDADDKLVARYDTRYHGLHNFASIKLYGDKAWDQSAVEEVVITGLTLYLCVVYRSTSVVPLVGSLMQSPEKERKAQEERMREEHERNLERERERGGVERPLDWDAVREGAEGKDVEAK